MKIAACCLQVQFYVEKGRAGEVVIIWFQAITYLSYHNLHMLPVSFNIPSTKMGLPTPLCLRDITGKQTYLKLQRVSRILEMQQQIALSAEFLTKTYPELSNLSINRGLMISACTIL